MRRLYILLFCILFVGLSGCAIRSIPYGYTAQEYDEEKERKREEEERIQKIREEDAEWNERRRQREKDAEKEVQRRREAEAEEKEREEEIQRQKLAEAWCNVKTTKRMRTWEEYVGLVAACVKLNQKLPKRGEGLDYGEEIRMDSGVIYHICAAPDSYVGHYFWSTVPTGIFGPVVEQVAYASNYKIEGNGCSFFLNFSPVWVYVGEGPGGTTYKEEVTGRGYFTSRVVVPRRRYQDVLCVFTGLEEFVNVYGEKSKLPKFQVVAVCGWNAYSVGRVNKIYTCDTWELDKIIKKSSY